MEFLDLNKEFDGASWINEVQRYEKNSKFIGCDVRVKVKSITKGKVGVEINYKNLPPKYEKAMKSLVLSICQGAFQWILISFSHSVAECDISDESRKTGEVIATSAGEFINTLFKEGFNGFKNVIRDRVNIMIAQYELSKLTYKDGKWKRWNGDIWDGTQWTNSKGEVYSDDVAIYLGRIVKVL